MSYTLLTGDFVIRYPDLPRGGPEPDGDTNKFTPDTPALVEALPRVSGREPELNSRGISVRLEGIDTLETHFEQTHQELLGANAARDKLLRDLGFRDVVFFADLPNKVQSANHDRLRGHVLSNGIDANGRMIGFVYVGDPAESDGSVVSLDAARLNLSMNARLLAAGQAYPAFYASLPEDLRVHLAGVSRAARAAGSGLWPRSTADPDGPATVAGLPELQQPVIWPKLFRRIVPFLAEGFTDFDDFDAWLRDDPVERDDAILILDGLQRRNLHDIISATGHRVQLTVWPEDFVIDPDPAVPIPTPTPTPAVGAADVLVVAALPNPNGSTEVGAESVTLLNTSAANVDLTGWAISDAANGQQVLSGSLAPGATVRLPLTAAVQLGNRGDTIRLTDGQGRVIDEVAYQRSQAAEGRTIA